MCSPGMRDVEPMFRDSSETCSSHARMLPGALAFVNMIEPSAGHFDEVAQAVGLLRGRGLTPVPHIPACRFSSREEMERALEQMRHLASHVLCLSAPPTASHSHPFCLFVYSVYISSPLFGEVSSEVTSHVLMHSQSSRRGPIPADWWERPTGVGWRLRQCGQRARHGRTAQRQISHLCTRVDCRAPRRTPRPLRGRGRGCGAIWTL